MNAAVPLRVTTDSLPSSRKVYVPGEIHADIRVPMRHIDVHPTAGEAGITVYDTSGPYTDPAVKIDIARGLPRLRQSWIDARGDTERLGLSTRARSGKAVTQLAYARAGIITPEMEYVAIREGVPERLVRDEIAARFPGHRIAGEEYGVSGDDDAPATWLIDPVDGTTNYVHGLPWSSSSCAVLDEEGAAVGAVADPYRREVLSAVRGSGAQRDGEPTRCVDTATLVGGIFLTELTMQWVWNGLPALMGRLADAGCVTRIMGSNAFSISAVAAGRCVATAIGGFNPGDCLAAALIAAEAGAVLPRGVPEDGAPFIAAAPGVADELLSIWPAA